MEAQDLAKLKQSLQHYPIAQAYLFGSHARGTAGALSDIDIAVVYQASTNKDEIESNLFAELSQQFKTDAIDIIDIETASPLLAHRSVLRGTRLLDHVPHEEAVLKTKILHAYEDTRHLRAIKEQAFV